MASEANPIDTGDENLSNDEQAALDADRQAETTERTERQAPPPAPAQQRPRQDTVPHAAMHEERRLRQEAESRARQREQELENERQESKKLRERTERILGSIAKGLNPDAPDPDTGERPLPDLKTDPLGHVLGVLERQGRVLNHLAGTEGQRRQMTEAQTEVNTIATRAQAQEREFMKTTPDYQAASTFLQQWRHDELADMGYTDPAQRQQMIAAEALQIARAAQAQNKNPAEIVYAAAVRRGFKAAPKANAEEAPAPEQEAPAEDNRAEQRIRNAERGQRENRSLGNARGGAKAPLSVDSLMAMSDDDFDRAMNTAEGRALMGS